MIDLRSDTKTQPSAEMRAAIAAAEVGDEQRREDPTVNELERRAAELLGQEEAVFVPTATMANEIALRTLSRAGRGGHRRGELAHLRLGARRACGVRRPDDAAAPLRGRTLHARADPGDGSRRRRDAHAPHGDRLGRGHPQRVGRPVLAAGGDRRGRRHGARARAQPAPRRRADHERVGRVRRAVGGDRPPVRHGHALSLEGAGLPARRDRRRLVRADGEGAPVQAPVRRRHAAGGDRRGRGRLCARAQHRAAGRGSRARAAARPKGSTRLASRSTSSRWRRTSCRSTWLRSGLLPRRHSPG